MDKYKQLEKDLKFAYGEALKAKTGEDGGSANMDATFLTLKNWRENKVLEAIKNAGLYCSGKTEWLGKGYMINTGGGQGNDRVRVRNKFKEILDDKGYDVVGFDKMD